MRKLLLVFFIIAAVAAAILFKYKFFDIEAGEIQTDNPVDFNRAFLIEKAKMLSEKNYEKPQIVMPDKLKNLNYDEYRNIRFLRKNGPWYGKNLPFEVQFFHLGSMFQVSVPIYEIKNGKAASVKYSSDFFDYGKNNRDNFDEIPLGYAGFRIHTPINNAKNYDELVAFLGASYFRGVAKGQKYGVSARGLAIDTAEMSGEEFPAFKEFYIERPTTKSKSVKVYALLDSPSITGAYKFDITPGEITKMKVKSTIFPRKNIKKLGVAPLTSMFLFGENNKNRFDDHRPEVHDSDGLLVNNGNGEWLWRPLDNSKYLRVSSFVDNNPKGFGLMQRDRNPGHYLDFETYYEQHPNLWVKPDGDWGKGLVQLVEIPSPQEIHDNIVAYWIPENPIEAGKEYEFNYTLYWHNDMPEGNNKAKITSTFFGIGGVSGMLEIEKRKFVVDFQGAGLKKAFDAGKVNLTASATEGKIVGRHLIYNPVTKGLTAYVDFEPNDKTSEIRILLEDKNGAGLSEIWSYQWLR